MTFLDCGAPSIYNRYAMQRTNSNQMGLGFKDRKKQSHEYIKSDFFKNYLKNYIEFCKTLPKTDRLVVSALDVIHNPEETLKIWLMFKNEGINAIPVWHLGSDESYLDDYINKYKLDFIGLGGMTPNPPSTLYKPLDRIWKKHLLNPDGTPKVKVHGFAMTAFTIMFRYPFYCVDSTAANHISRWGKIWVPSKNGMKEPLAIYTSYREETLKNPDHYLLRSKYEQEIIERYVKEFGYSFGSQHFIDEVPNPIGDRRIITFNKEKTKWIEVDEKGLFNDQIERWKYCMEYFKRLENEENVPIIFNSASTQKKNIREFLQFHRLLSYFDVSSSKAAQKELKTRLKTILREEENE